MLTPLARAAVAILATDIVFAVDSVPAVYGVTEDPFLVRRLLPTARSG